MSKLLFSRDIGTVEPCFFLGFNRPSKYLLYIMYIIISIKIVYNMQSSSLIKIALKLANPNSLQFSLYSVMIYNSLCL